MAAVRSFVSKQQNDWDVYVPLIASAIRSSINRSTGFTPNKLMLGRELTTPAELVIPGAEPESIPQTDYVVKLKEGLQMAHETARFTLKVQIAREKRNYDLKIHKHEFKRGDLVYFLDKGTHKGKSNKLSKKWICPAIIISVLTPYVFRIKFRGNSTRVAKMTF